MANYFEVDNTPTWPLTLPTAPLVASYSETHPSLATSVTTGNKSKIIRKTSTRAQVSSTISFNFTKSELEIFETFVYSTLEGGVVRFTFTHPRLKTEIETSFDASQENVFTVEPNGSMTYFKITAQFLFWS